VIVSGEKFNVLLRSVETCETERCVCVYIHVCMCMHSSFNDLVLWKTGICMHIVSETIKEFSG
jgi:hypothetical protein